MSDLMQFYYTPFTRLTLENSAENTAHEIYRIYNLLAALDELDRNTADTHRDRNHIRTVRNMLIGQLKSLVAPADRDKSEVPF